MTASNRKIMRVMRPAWEESLRRETLNAIKEVSVILRKLDTDGLDECIVHGLIPRCLIDSLAMARFVAAVVLMLTEHRHCTAFQHVC